MSLITFFERLLRPTEPPPPDPPQDLAAFYWYFVRQAKGLLLALFAASGIVALLDVSIPVLIGRLIDLVSTDSPASALQEHWFALAGAALFYLLVYPGALLLQSLIINQAIAPGFTNLVRWQSHWHVMRQCWAFFQSDFAGRIAHRVMQTGQSLRESVKAGINVVWYSLIYGGSAVGVLAATDVRLAIPLIAWFIAYVFLLRRCLPRMRDRSRLQSEAYSKLIGRVADIYTNILTIKLFARRKDEDVFVQRMVDEHTESFRCQLRLTTKFSLVLNVLNAILFVVTSATAMGLWSVGHVSVGAVATSLPLVWQIAGLAAGVAVSISNIFENVGIVQDGMKSIASSRPINERPGMHVLRVTNAAVHFQNVRFGYGMEHGVLLGVDLMISPSERIGLVGHSGAGKSTLVNLLLRLFELNSGRILIDGQNISEVTRESLRSSIAVVTQDTSLLHRSIRDNICCGKPDASDEEILDAARRARAMEFIERLQDADGRRGLDAYVGERGVKLSGGQRQRIAIARVILKNAPILVLDEATSALDSEVEGAIQEQLAGLMHGRTVIAIAHRLSTIVRMDRLAVMQQGRIIETGSHSELLELGGAYAGLWQRQSGGFRTSEQRLNRLALGSTSP